MSLFEGRALACQRGGRRVFEGLDFSLVAGGALLLTGPNGSGKSSLLRILAGLLAPASGTLLWDGVDIAEDPDAQRRRLHYQGHLDAVKPVLTVTENLAFWSELQGGSAAATALALAHFGLEALAETPGRLLSSGQRKRTALARLLAAPADLWLLDEPSVGLDRASLAQLVQAIAGHREAGGRVVVATHTDIPMPAAAVLALQDFEPRNLPEMVW